MFSADEKTIAELRDLRECLAAVDHAEATAEALFDCLLRQFKY